MIAESALHAYADGELDEEMVREVEAWLEENPAERERVEEWRQQKYDLRAVFDPVLTEQVPRELLAATRGFPRPQIFTTYMRMAAALLLFVAGGAAGWFASTNAGQANKGEWAQSKWPQFAVSAVNAHVLFTAEKRHAVEVPAKNKAHLVTWLSKWLGHEITPPDLSASGFSLIGGRLVPAGGWPGAQFMYENKSGARMTLFISKNEKGKSAEFRFWETKKAGCFFWSEGPFSYAITASVGKEPLKDAAEAVQDHFKALKL